MSDTITLPGSFYHPAGDKTKIVIEITNTGIDLQNPHHVKLMIGAMEAIGPVLYKEVHGIADLIFEEGEQQ